MKLKNCVPKTDWFGIGLAFAMFALGIALTLTWVGAILGIPMILGAIALLDEPKTLLGTPCAP